MRNCASALFAAGVLASGAASGGGLRPRQARNIPPDSIAGAVYSAVEADGHRAAAAGGSDESTIPLRFIAALCLAVGMSAVLCGAAPAHAGSDSFEAYLERAGRSAAFRAVADDFIDAAVAGKLPDLVRLVSPGVKRTSGDGVERYLVEHVVPFFADHRGIGKSITISNAEDESGNKGFAFYMYSVQKDGAQRPFVVYVLEEEGTKGIGNILVDRLVRDRHK